MNGGASAGNDNGGHRRDEDGHTEPPPGGVNSYMCPSTPPLMETPVFSTPVLPHPERLRCTGQVHGAPQAGLEWWQEGSPQFWLRRAGGTGPGFTEFTLLSTPPQVLVLTEFQLLSTQGPHTLAPGRMSRHPHPCQPTLPTDPAGWPQAGWPTGPLNPSSSSPGTSGCCSAGCGASPGTDLPPELRQGQAGIGDNPRDTVPRALSLGRGSVRGLKEIKRN